MLRFCSPERPFSFSSGLYPPGGLWPPQPVCLTSSFSCPVESDAPGTSQEPAAIPDR